jgi:cytochrome P450
MPRYTADSAQRLVIQGKEHIIPPRTTILLNFAALHRHPKYWGPDADDFRPDRWIVPAEADRPGNDNDSTSSPLLFQPEEAGSFVPWNLGPRICPGKKFSQVEFTRVIFTLFANGSRVELVNSNTRAQGESETEQEQEQDAKAKARALALRIIDEAKVEVTLKMVKPERIALKWVKKL